MTIALFVAACGGAEGSTTTGSTVVVTTTSSRTTTSISTTTAAPSTTSSTSTTTTIPVPTIPLTWLSTDISVPEPEGPYPVWVDLFDYGMYSNDVLEAVVPAGGHSNVFGGLCDPSRCVMDFTYPMGRIDCDLPDCGVAVSLMIEEPDHPDAEFSLHLDLHGLGTVRSWYAQIGYQAYAGGRSLFCNAYSYSSDAPRYWREPDVAFEYGEWHRFEITVDEVESGWGYEFSLSFDGDVVCSYVPPDLWDGDDSYNVIRRAVELYPADGRNAAPTQLKGSIDDFAAQYSPSG